MTIHDNYWHINADFCKGGITIQRVKKAGIRNKKNAVIPNSCDILNILHGTYFAGYKMYSKQKYVLKNSYGYEIEGARI
jgi:hypothetical protein